MNKKALGKGLSALIPDTYIKAQAASVAVLEEQKDEQHTVHEPFAIPIESIVPNHSQPRQQFEDRTLEELANSIKTNGVIQPVIVKKNAQGRYELVCGERRWRAAQKAGLATIPAIVKELSSDAFLETALVENIQREDLNPIEEAQAYVKLQETKAYSYEELAARVGKDRTTIINTIRLLKLPTDLIELLIEKQITSGHARALLAIPSEEYQRRLAKMIVEEGLSVRDVEELVRRKAYHKRHAKQARKIDAQIIDLERKLEERIGSKVRLFAGKNRGKIEIQYFSLDDLDRILHVLGVTID